MVNYNTSNGDYSNGDYYSTIIIGCHFSASFLMAMLSWPETHFRNRPSSCSTLSAARNPGPDLGPGRMPTFLAFLIDQGYLTL